MLYPAPYGALTPLFAGTMPEALNYNGEVRPTCSLSFSFSISYVQLLTSIMAVHDPVGTPGTVSPGGVRRRGREQAVELARGRGARVRGFGFAGWWQQVASACCQH